MKVIVLSIFILSLILSIRLYLYFQFEPRHEAGDILETEITLLEEPRILFGNQIVTWNNLRIEIPLENEVHYGDTISILGEIKENSFTSANGEEITFLVIKSAVINHLPTKNPFILSTAFIRNRVWEVFERTVPRSEAGLLYGIVFGGTQGFSSDLRESFRNTGVLHVVAASGMNVTLVSGFLFAVASRILKRRVAIIISILGIFYYALLAGFEPSIIRASLMASIAFTAAMLGRQSYSALALFLTGFVMLMISPRNVMDIGFLLSFSSTLGIIMVKPLLDSLALSKKTKGFSDDVTTTISAQIGSLPFMGAFFSSYSIISLIVNALVLWTIPLLMILGGIATVCAIVMPFITFIPLYIALPMLWYFEKMVMVFSGIPLLQFGNVPKVMWIGYYLVIFAFILKLQKKERE